MSQLEKQSKNALSQNDQDASSLKEFMGFGSQVMLQNKINTKSTISKNITDK